MQQSVTSLHSLAFVFCFLCGWRTGICCEHVAFWRLPCGHVAPYSCHTVALVLHITAVAILASTGCAHGLRSCWKSTKRSLQRFVLHIHPVSVDWLSFHFCKVPGIVKRSVGAAHSKYHLATFWLRWLGRLHPVSGCAYRHFCLSSVGCVNLVRFCRCFSTQTVHEQRATTCQRGKLLT